MDRFLRNYYRQLHFNSMPAEVRARFFDWIRNDTLTDDMRNWVRDYLRHQPAPNANQLMVDANGNYIPNALPDPNNNNVLSAVDAGRLFVAFQQAFAGMAADLNSFRDTDPQSRDFVNQYFGQGRMFNTSPATQDCANGINAILRLLNNPNLNLKDYIVANTQKSDGKPLFDSVTQLDDLLNSCQRREYDTNHSVQTKIQSVAKTLAGVVGWYSSIDRDSDEYRAIEGIRNEIANVTANNAFAMDPQNIDPTTLANFRSFYLGAPYNPNTQTGLLQTLYFNKTIRDRFTKYDNGVITGQINKAENTINWQDKSKENYIEPQVNDVSTPLQRLQEWVTDTYNDTFKKYEELRGATNFFQQEAKDIFKAIDKEKIKPIDGLAAILDKKSKIEGNLNNPVARQHFKWFVETMESLTKQMPNAIKGAWKDGRQMQAIISQIILRATDPTNSDPHAMEKAKTAMEIMTAMKYGMMTSKIMGAIKEDKELFNIFSNDKLSWNKNDGVKFVTGAFDKTVRAAFLGMGYGITIVHNQIKLSGRKYTNSDNQQGDLAARFTQENTNGQQALRDLNTADNATLNVRQQTLQRLNTGPDAVNAQNIQHMENTELTNRARLHQNAVNARQNAETRFNQITGVTQGARDRLQNEANWQNRHTTLQNEITQESNIINQLQQQIVALPNDPAGDARRNILMAQLQEHIQTYDDRRQQLLGIDNVHNSYTQQQQNADRVAEQQYTTAQNALNTATNAEANARQSHDDLQTRIQQYREAERDIRELTQAITNRNNALQNWPQANTNRVIELENYWNFLQDNSTSWSLFQNRAQQRFDRNKHRMLQDYIAQRGLAA